MARALLTGVVTAGGLVLGTAGAYSAVAYTAVLSAEREGARHERQLEAESSAQSELAQMLEQSEHATREMGSLLTQQRAAMLDTEKDLDSTRQRLHRLEEERREQEVAVADMEEQVAARRGVAADLQARLHARAETMAMLERSAAEARARAAGARAECNPLNHPLVQEYFSKK
ncbi:hypothetical protein WJX81_003240 [Elliptochloris bilobata]|uniref:Uncharacterized protein n=1 Tax=Elliptochloris bilobata TaxID=381761 RepID=A0AAW1RWI3_9CHLO